MNMGDVIMSSVIVSMYKYSATISEYMCDGNKDIA